MGAKLFCNELFIRANATLVKQMGSVAASYVSLLNVAARPAEKRTTADGGMAAPPAAKRPASAAAAPATAPAAAGAGAAATNDVGDEWFDD